MKQLIKKTTLRNGSLLISEEIPTLNSSIFGVFVRIGSDYENIRHNGISHIIEHMMFKGTKNRDAKTIAREIESLGGIINAYTSRDHTSYYFICLPEVMGRIIGIFQDMIFNSIIPQEQLVREKQVIIEELNSSLDDPQDLVFQNLNSLIYGKTQYAKTILGTKESIKSVSREDILKFMQKHYCNSNLFLSYAGPQPHKEIRDMISFDNINSESHPVKRMKRIPVIRGKVHYTYKPALSQFHVAMGRKGIRFDSQEKYAMLIINTILGSGMSSVFFRTLREDLGLVYEIYSFMESFLDSGVHGMYFVCDPRNFELSMAKIGQIMGYFTKGSIDEKEIEKAKTQIISSMKIGFDSLSGRMRYLARSMLYYDRIRYLDEMINAVQDVNMDDLTRVSSKYLKFDDFNVSIVGSKRKFQWKK